MDLIKVHIVCFHQGSKIALIPSSLQLHQAAGQLKILIFLVKIIFFPMYANIFCDAGKCLFKDT